MGDWASTFGRVAPGAKVYLFTGAAGNALDRLITRATTGVHHLFTLRPPLVRDDLGVQMGTADETQAILVRSIETASDTDLALLTGYLEPAKVRGQSLVLVGAALPDTDAARALRTRVSRRGVLVDVADPTGLVGRKHLVQWVTEDWQTTVAAATMACQRCDYSVQALVWASQVFHAFTSGRPVEGSLATTLVRLAVPMSATEEVYRLLLSRDPDGIVAARGLGPGQTLTLFRRLESALTDMMLLYPVLSSGQSVKVAASQVGMHIARALDLADWTPRYPPGVALRCRQALALGLENFYQPEAASTVAILWS